MTSEKMRLKGSALNRNMNHLRKKKLPGDAYATDFDLVLVSKEPSGVVAILDYKRQSERLTFSEVLAYETLKKVCPIFFVEVVDEEVGRVNIYRYQQAMDVSREPPLVALGFVTGCMTWSEYWTWEQAIREGWRQQKRKERNGNCDRV